LLILTKATIPRIIAGIAVRNKVKKLKIPSTKDAIAKPLVLTVGAEAIPEMFGRTQLQDWHNFALSGFSFPHLGQNIAFPFHIVGIVMLINPPTTGVGAK
jgi:hypothetical protein